MAEAVGDTEAATLFLQIFERGSKYLNSELFNGEYFHQVIDLTDQSILQQYKGAMESYWDEEHKQIKYQIGEGCILDQVLAQWHASLYGLGDIFEAAKVRTALKSIYQHNFKASMRSFANPCRLFSLNDEAGLVICDFPSGKQKPHIPIPYAQETMTGFEYAAAIQMIQVGMVEEGMRVIEAIRERYDGEKRNPWNEIECGSNYARTLASYALLNAFSGFQFDMTKGWIGFSPINLADMDGQPWRCFWSLDCAWGDVVIKEEAVHLNVKSGSLSLSRFALPFLSKTVLAVSLENHELKFEWIDRDVRFPDKVNISAGNTLSIRIA